MGVSAFVSCPHSGQQTEKAEKCSVGVAFGDVFSNMEGIEQRLQEQTLTAQCNGDHLRGVGDRMRLAARSAEETSGHSAAASGAGTAMSPVRPLHVEGLSDELRSQGLRLGSLEWELKVSLAKLHDAVDKLLPAVDEAAAKARQAEATACEALDESRGSVQEIKGRLDRLEVKTEQEFGKRKFLEEFGERAVALEGNLHDIKSWAKALDSRSAEQGRSIPDLAGRLEQCELACGLLGDSAAAVAAVGGEGFASAMPGGDSCGAGGGTLPAQLRRLGERLERCEAEVVRADDVFTARLALLGERIKDVSIKVADQEGGFKELHERLGRMDVASRLRSLRASPLQGSPLPSLSASLELSP